MANFNIQEDFIDYWDEVIRQWLSLNANVTGFKGLATEQSNVIKAINENCDYDKNYIINTIHMPEPYWGNPLEKCSIVLLDYNPAGGARINRHTTINCKECNGFCGEDNKMTVIRYVNEKKKYSDLALKCPVLKEYDDLKWFSDKDNGYEGYNWWQEKRKWLNHLVNTICGSNAYELLPFGIELCGWHSKKWSNNMKWIDKEIKDCKIKDCIKKRAIQPLFAAMKNSLGDSPVKIAVCIGAEFKPKLLCNFFDSDTFKDVTKEIKLSKQDLGKKENPLYEKYKDLSYSLENEEENIHVIAKWTETKKNGKTDYKKTNRNYRIYKITEDINNKKKNYYILNTHYSGSNSHPGEHFWPFEDVLIGKIKEYDLGIAYNNPSKHPTSHQVERVK